MNNTLKVVLPYYIKNDANLLGEFLRDVSFKGPGYGCYDTFLVHDSFNQSLPPDKMIQECKDILVGGPSLNVDPEDMRLFEEQYKELQIYYSNLYNLLVAWLWDGDGALYFNTGEHKLINTDCKKSTNWRFV